jgi:WXXGXW repeat (2 copies)
MRYRKASAAGMAAVILLGGCAEQPMGPSTPVMPAPNKSFQSFNDDQMMCRDYASQQVQGQVDQANNRMIGTAVIGTVLGAGLGAAIGGGRGAAIGAASGAGLGTVVGANNAQYASADVQQRYDVAYEQCGYSCGNQVPGAGQQPTAYQPSSAPPPLPSENVPPPPGPAFVWQPGYWQWNNYQYVWVPGHYTQRPTTTAVWIPDHWVQYNGGWMFVPGQWQG